MPSLLFLIFKHTNPSISLDVWLRRRVNQWSHHCRWSTNLVREVRFWTEASAINTRCNRSVRELVVMWFWITWLFKGTGRTDYLPQLESEDALDKTQFTIIAIELQGWGRSIPPERRYGCRIYEFDAKCCYQLMKVIYFFHHLLMKNFISWCFALSDFYLPHK